MPMQRIELPRSWTSITSVWPNARTIRLGFRPADIWVAVKLRPGETIHFQRGDQRIYLEVDSPEPIEITAIRQGDDAASGDDI